MQEVQSAALLCSVMEQEGFAVEKGICSISSFIAAARARLVRLESAVVFTPVHALS